MHNSKSIYEHIHPKKFFKDHVLQGVRPDGRKLLGYRPVALNVGIVSKTDCSASLRIGSSVFICGVNAEISCAPPASSVFVTLTCPTLQTSESDAENIPDRVVLCSNLISRIFNSQNIIRPESLRSSNGKAFWVLYCDILCTNYDGALLDGGLMVLAAALKTLKLPKIVFYENSDDFYVDPTVSIPIEMSDCPISTTYGIFEGSVVVVDPSSKEEQLCCLSQVSIVTIGEEICSIFKHGSSTIPAKIITPCISQALKRSGLVKKIIDTVVNKNR